MATSSVWLCKRKMKYVRKVMATGLAIVFLIALVIGTGVILSVRNVNVTFIEYSGNYREEYEATRKNFNSLKGSSLLFISDGNVTGKVIYPNLFAVESYEKKFPCTVDVTLRERIERFALKTDGGYKIYDDRGELLRSTSDVEKQPLNVLDNCPDVLLEADEGQVKAIAELMGYFDEYFGPVRKLAEKVEVGKWLELQIAIITLRSGTTVRVSDWSKNLQNKILRASEVYSELSDAQKTKGAITVADGRENTDSVARYSD